MNDKHFDDFLQQQLQGSSAYLDDGDFSARVMAGLPVQKRLHPWLEKLIIVLPVTLITLFVASQFSLRGLIQPAYGWLLTLTMHNIITLSVGLVLILLIAPIALILKPRALF